MPPNPAMNPPSLRSAGYCSVGLTCRAPSGLKYPACVMFAKSVKCGEDEIMSRRGIL